MDGESIRNGLRDIFGDFNDLCQQISNTSGALSHRHGVVAPATPVGPRPNPFAPNNSISRPRTPPSTQSARICLQTMADLVEETPLQPLAPASFNRDLHQEPSTSSASSKTYDDATDLKRKKRKNRTNDSDSDMETRKRHAQDHSVKPSTSRGGLPPPVYKDLFGDDTSKPNETSEKAISPDSGVHSNEGIDEADISQIIHVMSDLMPMLSPIMSRPYEMYRQWKEKSRKERKEQKKKREEEKERREQEEKDRRRREDLERKTTEERERREAEEKERRESEERIRREQEDEKKREEERTKKEAEERQRQREEEKQRKEEERLRKLKREEEKQRAKEAEKKKKEAEELERARLEKAEKEKEERRRIQQQEELDRQSPDSKFSGTLTLRNLSNDRLSQLLDISRKSTKLEKLEGGRSSSRPVSPFPSKLEKEDRLASEGKLESRLEAKLDVKNVPSPRSSSSKRSGDFHCAGNECIPPKPILPTKVKDGEGASPGEVYQEMAKAKKRQADIQDDKVKRILLYLECMVYFTMAAQYYIQHERNGYSHLSIIRDTATLISGVTNRFLYHDNLTPLDQHFTSRVRVLSIRAQSILGFHAFNIKMASTIKTASIIDKSDGKCHFHNADDQQPVPSPSENQNSGSNPAANIMVTMPVEVYNCYKTQLKHLHGLMNAHKLWADSASYISKSPADTLFINSLEALCGALTIMSPIDKLGIFILTAVSWLRDEQELELKRPQPPPLKEAIKKSR